MRLFWNVCAHIRSDSLGVYIVRLQDNTELWCHQWIGVWRYILATLGCQRREGIVPPILKEKRRKKKKEERKIKEKEKEERKEKEKEEKKENERKKRRKKSRGARLKLSGIPQHPEGLG